MLSSIILKYTRIKYIQMFYSLLNKLYPKFFEAIHDLYFWRNKRKIYLREINRVKIVTDREIIENDWDRLKMNCPIYVYACLCISCYKLK